MLKDSHRQNDGESEPSDKHDKEVLRGKRKDTVAKRKRILKKLVPGLTVPREKR